MPIGMFGFLAAVGLAIGIAALLAFMPTRAQRNQGPCRRPAQRRDGPALRLATSTAAAPPCPRPAQSELDAISAALPSLAPDARAGRCARPQCAGRAAADVAAPAGPDRPLRHVPPAFREERDGEGISVDERLVEGPCRGPRRARRNLPRSSRARTSARSKRRAASSSRATAKTGPADPPEDGSAARSISMPCSALRGFGSGIRAIEGGR